MTPKYMAAPWITDHCGTRHRVLAEPIGGQGPVALLCTLHHPATQEPSGVSAVPQGAMAGAGDLWRPEQLLARRGRTGTKDGSVLHTDARAGQTTPEPRGTDRRTLPGFCGLAA